MIQTRFHLFKNFIGYYFRSVTLFDIHSPLIADFVANVIDDNRNFYAFFKIETLRDQLLRNTTPIEITDLGAGSKANPNLKRSIRNIAMHAPVSPRIGAYLFKIAHWRKPAAILELGTSFGISSLYLASANTKTTFYTIEGCPNTAAIAQKHFTDFNYSHLQLINQSFSEGLKQLRSKISNNSLDLVYIDGHHEEGATLAYFDQIQPYLTEKSLVIIADIHWSETMHRAWDTLKNKPQVTSSIDLFHLGILFFDHSKITKEHYTIVPKSWKPWHLGLFARKVSSE